LSNNIVIGDGNHNFAVRLNVKHGNTISFLHSGTIRDTIISGKNNLLGYNGFFYDNRFFFAIGDGGVAVLGNDGFEIKPAPENLSVNSISNDYQSSSFLAVSPDGKIWEWGNPENLGTLNLAEGEQVIKFVKDFDNTSILILTTNPAIFGQEMLYRWSRSGGTDAILRHRNILRVITTPDGFIYTLDNNGRLSVWDRNGRSNTSQQEEIIARLGKLNIPPDYILNDIAIFGDNRGYSLAFASNRGVFYSPNEIIKTPFEHFYKNIPIRSGLREVYAEPGILAANDRERNRYATFRYALDRPDRITIDIFNYNLDFVVRIAENEFRQAASDGVHSTNARVDRWDGTVNNNGGRRAPPGVYFFKITTQEGRQSAFGRIVVAR
jgi:hypothetical protein